jgi:hypothetical protein
MSLLSISTYLIIKERKKSFHESVHFGLSIRVASFYFNQFEMGLSIQPGSSPSIMDVSSEQTGAC